MLGALQADWDFSLISRRAEALYGPLGEGKQRIDAWQHLLATQQQVGVRPQRWLGLGGGRSHHLGADGSSLKSASSWICAKG